jgi:hypothetical protein
MPMRKRGKNLRTRATKQIWKTMHQMNPDDGVPTARSYSSVTISAFEEMQLRFFTIWSFKINRQAREMPKRKTVQPRRKDGQD